MRSPRWLRAQAARARAGDQVRILDVGCGVKPYYPFFARVRPSTSASTSSRTRRPSCSARSRRCRSSDASFDVVLCTQVLEHCDDPAQAVRELRRVTAPGGRVLASTHGVQVYHPSPVDYWRWTHEGLRRLFEQNAAWSRSPSSPQRARRRRSRCCSARMSRSRCAAPFLARPPVWLLNQLGARARRADRRSSASPCRAR